MAMNKVREAIEFIALDPKVCRSEASRKLALQIVPSNDL